MRVCLMQNLVALGGLVLKRLSVPIHIAQTMFNTQEVPQYRMNIRTINMSPFLLVNFSIHLSYVKTSTITKEP
jgi:hypothetical protein